MSSKYARDTIKTFIGNNSAESLIDFSAEYRTIDKLLADTGLSHSDSWIGIEFLPSDEAPLGMVSNNSGGCYRERGSVLMHVVAPISLTHRDDILTRAEALLQIFRGATINGDIYVESLTHANFATSATLSFERGYESAAITLNFYRNYNF